MKNMFHGKEVEVLVVPKGQGILTAMYEEIDRNFSRCRICRGRVHLSGSGCAHMWEHTRNGDIVYEEDKENYLKERIGKFTDEFVEYMKGRSKGAIALRGRAHNFLKEKGITDLDLGIAIRDEFISRRMGGDSE